MRYALAAAVLLALSCEADGAPSTPARPVAIRVSTASRVATVDERFLSVAVDAAQVVGAKFWDPSGKTESGSGTLTVPPYDFSRPKLRTLARELAPAYLRVGGSEADRIHYDMTGGPPSPPPPGFKSVLTRAQWDGVHDFARAVDFGVVFTLAAGPGPRGAAREWTPDDARPFLEYTRDRGYSVALFELGNEVNAFPFLHGLDFVIRARDYVNDVVAARALLRGILPASKLGAPSSAYWPVSGETVAFLPEFLGAGGGRLLDVVTWHYYPTQSRRCALATRRSSLEWATDPRMLDEVDRWAAAVEKERDLAAPGVPVWLGETGNAQCGGEPGISDAFAGTLWWIDHLGMVARRGQPVLVRQTLSGSNYGLLDDASLEPRPDYWAAVLWRRLMGTGVLKAEVEADPLLRAYAHCARGGSGVVLAAVNLDRDRAATLVLDDLRGDEALVYALSAPALTSSTVRLNGATLALTEPGALPPLEPRHEPRQGGALRVRLEPTSAAFVALPAAEAPGCP